MLSMIDLSRLYASREVRPAFAGEKYLFLLE